MEEIIVRMRFREGAIQHESFDNFEDALAYVINIKRRLSKEDAGRWLKHAIKNEREFPIESDRHWYTDPCGRICFRRRRHYQMTKDYYLTADEAAEALGDDCAKDRILSAITTGAEYPKKSGYTWDYLI